MTDTDIRSAKASDDSESTVVLRVDRKLWLEGGNVIFAAHATRLGTSPTQNDFLYFKVYRELLCYHSPIFRDMFNIPPPAEQEELDGIPLVHLPDDALDLQSFLRFIYCPSWEPQGTYPPDYGSKMRGALKLCLKYEAEELKDHIFARLRLAWPRSLAEWDRRRWLIEDKVKEEFDQIWEIGSGPHSQEEEPDDEDFEPYAIIAMIRESHCEEELRDVLGLAYYDLACYPRRTMKIPPGYLVESDLRRVLLGRDEFLKILTGNLLDAPGGGSLEYCVLAECRDGRNVFWTKFWENLSSTSDYISFLSHAKDPGARLDWFYGSKAPTICPDCRHKINKLLRHTRESLFSYIPDIFITPIS